MKGLKIPQFHQGHVVTAEMLNALKEYAFEAVNLHYEGYSDGIIKGCEITPNDGYLTIEKGMVIYKGDIYLLNEDLYAEYHPSDKWTACKLVFGKGSLYHNVTVREMTAVVTDDLEKNSNSLEICRFRLQEGASLRKQYRDYWDMNTEYNTVNEIYAEWSGYGTPTISPKVLLHYVKELEKKGTMDGVDFSFCQQIYEAAGRSINRKTITLYLNQKSNIQKEDYTNLEIYQQFDRLLKSPSMRQPSRMMVPPRKIIVD